MNRLRVIAVVFATVLVLVSASQTFDAYRLIQYKSKSGNVYGSQRGGFSLFASTDASGSLKRSALFLHAEELCRNDVNTFVNGLIENQRAEALVIVLPSGSGNSAQCADVWTTVENFFLNQKFLVPVFFVPNSAELQSVERQISTSGSSETDHYHAVVSLSDASALKDPKLVNIQGVLGSTVPNGSLVITAHYDSFSIAPGLSVRGGSGAAALLYVARALADLEARGAPARARVVFVLTAGGNENHAGLQHWLGSVGTTKLAETVDTVLSLDELDGAELFLHAARPDAHHDALLTLAAQAGVPLSVVISKPNATTASVAWPHERVLRQKSSGFTLSARREGTPQLSPQSLLVQGPADARTVLRNARLVAEFAARHLYVLEGAGLAFADPEHDVLGLEFVQAWLAAFAATPRMSPFTAPDAPLVSSLERTLKQHAREVTRQSFVLQPDIVFYGSESAALDVYRTKGAVFDVVLLAVIAAYIAAFSVAIMGVEGVKRSVRSLIGSSS